MQNKKIKKYMNFSVSSLVVVDMHGTSRIVNITSIDWLPTCEKEPRIEEESRHIFAGRVVGVGRKNGYDDLSGQESEIGDYVFRQ